MLFTPALLDIADRLAAKIMALIDAVSPIALGGSTSTFSEHAATILFFRLNHLLCTLIRINNCGLRAPATPKPPTDPAPTDPAPTGQPSGQAFRLPTHPGWLLDALPDIAPAVAADIQALLAGLDLPALLAAAPA